MRQAENQSLIAHLSLIVLISACSLCGGAGNLSSMIPIPGAGQWVDFGRNEPTITNGAFTFPSPSGVAGYFYTKPPATIAQGQTVTLVYSIDGNTPEWGVSDPADVPPATIHLFLWRGGDDLSCNGVMASYRFWAPSGVTLKLGDSQTLTSVLDPSVWTNCYLSMTLVASLGRLRTLWVSGLRSAARTSLATASISAAAARPSK